MVIETDRLIMREMTEDDFDALYAVLADSDIMQHYPYTFDGDRVREWIRKNIERYKVFGFGLWAVVLKETGEMIGDCGLTMQIINEQIRPEIGYHIRKDCQQRGYASEAAKAVGTGLL
jgi:RimJ/RimL family protein N-acetyltransferase